MQLVSRGIYKPGEQLMSVRSLATKLGLNVNTVVRAFNELESMGIIESVPGKGFYVTHSGEASDALREKAREELKNALQTAKKRGLELEDTIKIASEIFSREENRE